MTDESKNLSFMDMMMQKAAEDDSNKDIDVIVGGELITYTATLIGESSFKPAKERGWLSAMTRANGNRNIPESERLKNVRDIAREAIKRGVLTEQQVNERLTELGIGGVPSTEIAIEEPTESKVEDVPSTELADTPDQEVHTGLKPEEISELSNAALRRKRLIDDIDESSAWDKMRQGSTPLGGLTGQMADQASELPQLKQKFILDFNEDYPGGDDLMIALNKLPQDIGERFDAHGIAKGNNFESLINLLQNGVDQNKSFHTMPLVDNPDYAAIGATAPYTDGGIIVVGPVNSADSIQSGSRQLIVDRENNSTNIKYVILDKHYYFAIPQLEKAFPNVRFVRADNLTQVMTEEVQKADRKIT